MCLPGDCRSAWALSSDSKYVVLRRSCEWCARTWVRTCATAASSSRTQRRTVSLCERGEPANVGHTHRRRVVIKQDGQLSLVQTDDIKGEVWEARVASSSSPATATSKPQASL